MKLSPVHYILKRRFYRIPVFELLQRLALQMFHSVVMRSLLIQFSLHKILQNIYYILNQLKVILLFEFEL